VSSTSKPAPSFEVPDLVIPAPAPSRPRVAAVPAPARVSAPSPDAPPGLDDLALGDGADLQLDLGPAPAARAAVVTAPTSGGGLDPFDDVIDDGVKLDLADIPPPRTTSGTFAAAGSAPAPISSRTGLGGSLPPASDPRSGPLSHRSLPVPESDVDPFEARALADYGDVPTAPWQAPLYALRVLRRRGELRRALAERRAELLREGTRADDAVVAFAERVRPAAEANGWRGFVGVAAEEEVLRGRDGGLAGEMDAHRAELARVDAALAEVEASLAQAKAEETMVAEHLSAAEATKARAEAKVKRIDIELRNAAAQPGADPAQVQALLAARNGERAALLAEISAEEPKLAEIQGRLAAARRNVAAAAARVTVVQGDRREVEDRFRRKTGTRSQGVEEARARVRGALIEAGRMALADEGAFGADYAAARAEVRLAVDRQRKAEHAVKLHEAALASDDPKKVTLGFVLIGAAVVLLLVLLLFPFIWGAIVNA
jgi:hypothetical protein